MILQALAGMLSAAIIIILQICLHIKQQRGTSMHLLFLLLAFGCLDPKKLKLKYKRRSTQFRGSKLYLN